MVRAKRRSRSYWTTVVEEFRQSGQSVQEFTAAKGIRESTFRPWLTRLGLAQKKKPKKKAKPEQVRLLPISVPPQEHSGGAMIEVDYAGLCFRFPSGTDSRYVGDLFIELRAAC